MPLSLRTRQQGIASVVVALLIVVGVMFILMQALRTSNIASTDTVRQMDSTAALLLAESGLQRLQSVVLKAAQSNTLQESTCTAFNNTGPYSLDRGSFSYPSATASPAGCSATGTPCARCTATVTGTVGSTLRSLEATLNFTAVNGTTGKGQTVTMVLKNTYDRPALALFNLAWRRQGSGGNATASYCTNGATDCGNRYHVVAQAGQNDVGALGVSVGILANTDSKPVSQTLSANRAYAEVGALFPALDGATTWPKVLGSYWDDASNGNSNSTVGTNNVDSGLVNSGVANTTANCVASPNTYSGGSKQTCNSWCRDTVSGASADTLVFGISGRSGATGSVQERINQVTFNTSGTPAQAVPLSRLVHFPTADIVNSTDVFSEIWKVYNPAFGPTVGSSVTVGGATATYGATSYGTYLAGTIGAQVTTGTIANNATSMSVTAVGSGRICIGDVLSRSGGQDRFQAATLVTTTPDNATGGVTGQQCSSRTGTYNFSKATTNNMNGTLTINATSSKFVLHSTALGALTLNTPLQQDGTSVATATAVLTTPGDSAVHTLSTTPGGQPRLLQTYTQGGVVTGTDSGGVTRSIITVPGMTTGPDAGTILNVFSGTGVLGVSTKPVAPPGGSAANQIWVDNAPSTPLRDAVLCGGICALFNNASSTTATTEFQVIKSSGTRYWAGGFMCLSGVKDSIVVPVTSSSTTGFQWKESVQ
jgi:hypothetical protein